MPDPTTRDLYRVCADFLARDSADRLLMLRQLGLARYAPILTQMRPGEQNIACVARFFQHPDRVKFPDLRGADLSGLVLDGVNFIRGDLSGANLRGSRLRGADLVFAQLTDADLSGADLSDATLNETRWSGARVEGCRLGAGVGLSATQRADLKARGAVD